MRVVALTFIALVAASSSVDFIHPTCATLKESSKDGVRFRVANRCSHGLVFDFAPTLDGKCWFNTCNGTSDEHWTLNADGSVSASYDNFARDCAKMDSAFVYAMPVDCATMQPVSAVEELHLQLDVSSGYSVEFRRNWWTANEDVVLEFETQTEKTDKVLSIDPDDTNVAELLRNSGCAEESGKCVQTWHMLLRNPIAKQFTAHVRLQTGHRIIREKVTFNVENVKGDVSEWQKTQVVDALLFTSGALETPVYPDDKVVEGEELCAHAIAPGAHGLYAHGAYTCDEHGCVSLAGAQPSSTNTSFFCFTPQKRASGEQTIEIDYEVNAFDEEPSNAELPDIPAAKYAKRSWSSTVTTTNGTIIKRRWIVVVVCPDDEVWDGVRCIDDDDFTDDAFWWLWIVMLGLAFCLIAACLIAAVSTPEWGWDYFRSPRKTAAVKQ